MRISCKIVTSLAGLLCAASIHAAEQQPAATLTPAPAKTAAPDVPGKDAAPKPIKSPGPVDEAYATADANHDGVVSPEEFAMFTAFRKWDLNGDGKLERKEFDYYFASNPMPGGGMPGARITQGNIADLIMKKLDANGDGRVTKDEAGPALGESFDSLDRNKDGALSFEDSVQSTTPHTPAPRGNPVAALMRYDANKDGKVELSELPENLRKTFAALDANKDGVIEKEEIEKPAPGTMGPEHEKLAEKMRERNKAVMEQRRKAAAERQAKLESPKPAGPPAPIKKEK